MSKESASDEVLFLCSFGIHGLIWYSWVRSREKIQMGEVHLTRCYRFAHLVFVVEVCGENTGGRGASYEVLSLCSFGIRGWGVWRECRWVKCILRGAIALLIRYSWFKSVSLQRYCLLLG